MKLVASLTSPFARKIRILLAEKELPCVLEVDIPWNADTRVPQSNPLGKVPVLVLEDGSTVYDSRVIAEYLDELAEPRFIPPVGSPERLQVKCLEALADGISDAAAAIFLERRRPPAQISEEWIRRQQEKIARGLAALSTVLGKQDYLAGNEPTLADFATVSCLGYLALRFPEVAVPDNLAAFRKRLEERPAVKDTAPPPA